MPGEFGEIDVEELNVYISPTGAAGTFTELFMATGIAFSSGKDGKNTIKAFGKRKIIRAGTDVDSYDISALFGPAEQKTLRDAKRAGEAVSLILAWDDEGISTGGGGGIMNGQLQSVKIEDYNWEGDADGDLARFSFTAEGEGPLTEISVLP